MTGTFIPLQAQPTGWGSQSLNPNASWSQPTGWNPGSPWSSAAAWYPGSPWSPTATWNPSASWENNTSQNTPETPAAFTPYYSGVPSGWHGGSPALSQSFAAELAETNHEFVLSFDVPGINVEDLDVSLSGNTIFINGIRKDSQEAKTLAYSEIAKGNITRAISVPFDLSASKAINTSLDNGVLKIRIAKETPSEKRTTPRKVKIG
ncbi:MAG: heat shock protein Hsp20 [Alphaproteobacteria bacterium]|jgi:HSP20 family protein|nr:heat shock protein Hsp20 [Alphaproteobacteria bacterium]